MTLVEGIHDKINKSCIVLFLNKKKKAANKAHKRNHLKYKQKEKNKNKWKIIT